MKDEIILFKEQNKKHRDKLILKEKTYSLVNKIIADQY